MTAGFRPILLSTQFFFQADGQCNSPDDVENADLRPDQPTFLVNDTVNYTCDTGYQHTAGDLNRTCLLNGTWTGDAPHCSGNQQHIFIIG